MRGRNWEREMVRGRGRKRSEWFRRKLKSWCLQAKWLSDWKKVSLCLLFLSLSVCLSLSLSSSFSLSLSLPPLSLFLFLIGLIEITTKPMPIDFTQMPSHQLFWLMYCQLAHSTAKSLALPYLTLHCLTLNCLNLHCLTLHCLALHCLT